MTPPVQRTLIREHTRVMVTVLYCRYASLLDMPVTTARDVEVAVDAYERFKTAKETYRARENRREAQHAEP